MDQAQIVQNVAKYVEEKTIGEGSGHDWWHIVRVRNMAERIAEVEGGNLFICQIAALVHDLADDKLGEKAAVYIGNKDFMSKEANRKAMKERADFLSNKGDNYIKNMLISKGYYY